MNSNKNVAVIGLAGIAIYIYINKIDNFLLILGGCAESIAYKLNAKGYQVSAYLDRKPSSPLLGIHNIYKGY